MVGIGTGFDDNITDAAFRLIDARCEGLERLVEDGLPPADGLRRELREIEEYTGLASHTGPGVGVARGVLAMLRPFYIEMERRVRAGAPLPLAKQETEDGRRAY